MSNKANELLKSFDKEIKDVLALDYCGYLSSMSSCFNHSYVNAFLVRKAMPDAVMLADELSWINVFNRKVTVKRDAGIQIVVPGVMTRSDDRVSDGRLMIEKMPDQEPERFKAVKVDTFLFYPKIEVLYDISQTTGPEIKKPRIDTRNWDKQTDKALQNYDLKFWEKTAVKSSILYVVARYFELMFEAAQINEIGQMFSRQPVDELRVALYEIQTTVCDLIHQIQRQRSFDLKLTPHIERAY